MSEEDKMDVDTQEPTTKVPKAKKNANITPSAGAESASKYPNMKLLSPSIKLP